MDPKTPPMYTLDWTATDGLTTPAPPRTLMRSSGESATDAGLMTPTDAGTTSDTCAPAGSPPARTDAEAAAEGKSESSSRDTPLTGSVQRAPEC